MSSLTSGSSGSGHTSRLRRFLAVMAVDSGCFVVLAAGAFASSHYFSWTVLIVGAALLIHTVYLFRDRWPAEGWFQGVAAIVAVVAGFGMVTSSGGGSAPPQPDLVKTAPVQSTPVPTTPEPTTPASTTGFGTGNFYCSAGHCYQDGVQLTIHP